MAVNLRPKAPAEAIRYAWRPPLDPTDTLSGVTVAVTSGTVAVGRTGTEYGEAYFYLSGGALNETAVVTVTATTSDGATFVETFVLPVRASANVLEQTVADVLSYALRPIVGMGRQAKPAEQADARENLDMMLASWAERGADLGVKLPTAEADVLAVPDAYISAIKSCLRVRLCEFYGRPVDRSDALASMQGMILITHKSLPEDRQGVYL